MNLLYDFIELHFLHRPASTSIITRHASPRRDNITSPIPKPTGQGARWQQVASLLGCVQKAYDQGSYFQLPSGLKPANDAVWCESAPVDQKLQLCTFLSPNDFSCKKTLTLPNLQKHLTVFIIHSPKCLTHAKGFAGMPPAWQGNGGSVAVFFLFELSEIEIWGRQHVLGQNTNLEFS